LDSVDDSSSSSLSLPNSISSAAAIGNDKETRKRPSVSELGPDDAILDSYQDHHE
jgi:hypothetical protein